MVTLKVSKLHMLHNDTPSFHTYTTNNYVYFQTVESTENNCYALMFIFNPTCIQGKAVAHALTGDIIRFVSITFK